MQLIDIMLNFFKDIREDLNFNQIQTHLCRNNVLFLSTTLISSIYKDSYLKHG